MSETLTERMKRFGSHSTFVPLLPKDVLAAINAAFAAGAFAGAREALDVARPACLGLLTGLDAYKAVEAIDPVAVAQRVTDERNGDG